MQDLKTILVVDDDADMRCAVSEALKRRGYGVTAAADGEEALALLSGGRFNMIVSDVKMPGLDGMGLLKAVKKRSPETPVLLVTAFGTIEKAVEAVKEGAVDFILKPFELDALEAAVEKSMREETSQMRFETRGKEMITVDPLMRKVMSMATTAAGTDATVLISGESGTGKELLARYIHSKSPRASKPFVAVNCASIPEGLLESELFGHEKGAFTGAVSQRCGKFEQANTGTILLDEISEMELKLQAKLLRVIQEKEVERLGGKTPVPLDMRIIATTNRDMKKEVAEGRFREDLFYRLNIFPLALPPLRERKADLEFLATHFMKKFSQKYSRHLDGIAPDALRRLTGAEWRGNIRELENTMERMVLISHGTTLGLEHLEACMELAGSGSLEAATAGGVGVNIADNTGVSNMTLSEMERGLIYKTLDDVEWNRTRAARILGISVRTLRNKLKEYGQNLPG